MNVIFLHGPAAAGKYTIGSLLSPLVDMPLFHNHLVIDAVSALFEFGTPGFVQLREQLWLDCFRAAAQSGQSFIFTFHPEATVSDTTVSQMQEIVELQGGRIHFVSLCCPHEQILARLDSPSRAEFGKLRDPHLYQQLLDQGSFAFPQLPESMLEVDTDALAPIDAAHLIAQTYQQQET